MSLKDYREYSKLTNRIHRAIEAGHVSHAYIIEGDSCTDKEKIAKDFVKAILCENNPGWGCDECVNCRKIDHDNYEDLYAVNADENSLKDAAILSLQEKLKGKPTGGSRNIAIISDADTMTQRAQNRLLKTLEEPTPGTVIVLLSENTENLLQTIRSRCIIYRLGNFVSSNEHIDLKFPETMLKLAMDGAYFCDLKSQLDKHIKDRKEAFVFLDGMERLFRQYMTASPSSAEDSAPAMRKEKIIENVRIIEEARRDLLANVNYKYALRNLILKIGG